MKSVTAKRLGVSGILSLLFVGTGVAAVVDSRLADAAEQGDTDAVRALLKQHADVNVPQADGATALAWAAYRDNLDLADLLLAAGAKPNAANEYGVTPLLLACTNRSAPMVDRLLKARANPNAASEWTGETALIACSGTGSLDAVKLLLAHGADVKSKDLRQGHTTLMWALAQNHADVAKALIEAGADVNAHAKSGFTPLMFAAQQGDLDSSRALIAAGAKVNDVTNGRGMWEGQTPLLVASLNGHEELATFLLDQGANPNAADQNGLTALHFCLMRGLARFSRVQPRSYTPFLNRPNMVNLLKALLAHGANPNARIKSATVGNEFYKAEASPFRPYEPILGTVSPVGATPFLLAAITYDIDIMRLLKDAGADPLLATEDNVTPIMVAATLGRPRWTTLNPDEGKRSLEAVKLAVEFGGDVNAADSVLGLTALHAAAYSGSDAIIQFLVEKGANVNAKDKAEEMPLNIAVIGQTADGGAGNRRPSLRWKGTAATLVKLGAFPVKVSSAPGIESLDIHQ